MKAPNARWTVILCAVTSVLVFLHIAYSAQSNKQMLQGTFFASGILIMSGGTVYDTSLRLQSHGYKLHDFEEINKKVRTFPSLK
ncbi:hypothetical protein K2E95_14485 [Pseudomonas sp. ERGC3:01]|nr:hypothetical protein [Pseudomonas sp. ERGC3:01]